MLSRVFHCFPLCSDRYIALKAEIGHFIDENSKAGLRNLIACGAFEIGMERFLFELAMNFNTKIYMPESQRQFLDELIPRSKNAADNICVRLKELVVDDQSAMIHVLRVQDISNDVSQIVLFFSSLKKKQLTVINSASFQFLMKYISRYNCHRVLGIRPRSCDKELGTVVDGAHKIFGNENISDYDS